MALILYRDKCVIFRIAYVGIPSAGKSTLMQSVIDPFPADQRGDRKYEFMENDRLLSFDIHFPKIEIIPHFKTFSRLITLPGYPCRTQPYRQMLKGIDGIVFVIDSQWERMSDNVKAFYALQEILAFHKTSLREIPSVLIYNKRDHSKVAPLSYLDSTFNDRASSLQVYENERTQSLGAQESFRYLYQKMTSRYSSGQI